MKRSRFTETQIFAILQEAEEGKEAVGDLPPARHTMRTAPITAWEASPLPCSDGRSKRKDVGLRYANPIYGSRASSFQPLLADRRRAGLFGSIDEESGM